MKFLFSVVFHMCISMSFALKLIMYFFSFHRLTRNKDFCPSLPTSLVVFAALKLHLMNKQSWLKFISSHSFHNELKSCFFQLRNCSNLSMLDHYLSKLCYVSMSLLFYVTLFNRDARVAFIYSQLDSNFLMFSCSVYWLVIPTLYLIRFVFL